MTSNKQPGLRVVEEDSDESVVRLVVDGGDESPQVETVEKLTNRIDGDVADLLKTEGQNKIRLNEQELDKIFSEEKPSRHDHANIRKMLESRKSSKASQMRMKSGEYTMVTLVEQISDRNILEDEWSDAAETATSINTVVRSVSIGIGIILVGSGVFSIWKITQSDGSEQNERLILKKESRELLIKDSLNALDSLNTAETMLRNYFNAETIEERLTYIHRGEELREQILAYYAKNPLMIIKKIVPLYIKPSEENSGNIWNVLFTHGNYNEGVKIFLHKGTGNDFKVDWLAETGAEIDDIKGFVESKSTESHVFRFEIQQEYDRGFYNWGFKDRKYVVVRLNIPGDDQTYWGYISLKNQSLLYKMKRFFNHQEKYEHEHNFAKNKVILKVSFLPDTAVENKECFIVEDMISPNWVYENQGEIAK